MNFFVIYYNSSGNLCLELGFPNLFPNLFVFVLVISVEASLAVDYIHPFIKLCLTSKLKMLASILLDILFLK